MMGLCLAFAKLAAHLPANCFLHHPFFRAAAPLALMLLLKHKAITEATFFGAIGPHPREHSSSRSIPREGGRGSWKLAFYRAGYALADLFPILRQKKST